MRKFLLIIFIAFIVCLNPLSVNAQSNDNSNREYLEEKIALLMKQVELLRAQIALMSLNRQTSVSQKNCAQVEVSWERVSSATSYRVYRNNELVYEGSSRSFIDDSLNPGQKYKYMVYGLYRGEQGEPSEIQEIVAPSLCPPGVPRLSFSESLCGGQININWQLNSQATVYQLYRGNREIYSGSLNRFIDIGLTPNRDYEYKIRAGNIGGWSDFSENFSFQSSSVCAPSAPEISYIIPETSQEGILSIETRTSPRNNTRIRAGVKNQSVMAFDATAHHSDIGIARLDLFFNVQPWRYLDKIVVQYAGRNIYELSDLNRNSFTRLDGDIYRLRIENIQPIVREGRSGIFNIRVDAKEVQLDGRQNIIVFLQNNSIRGIDGAGLWQYAPKTGGGEGKDFSRLFYID